ncbi:heavy-metal-associated domain-containing protein [Tissierella praeacuta]|uniref:Copper chaperone CopZ n=1 Tax=Tissierella praeacuta DSM 18095 TaxID=1123404 RepID=A0A1M4VPQ3_9FIRM|nr:cation transporter [Tissierella praeacuta]HAE91751.1 copper chaperone [Tissierella sp.]MBU5256527.1 cation transporter [Tissierella praeacuta]TCU79365.1 copper chaperone [Tissierella praeacuta]SHE70830.1 Copper chaperone CopZ [Tissierella praeacuta DSM 18095]SUO98983.1 Copper-ion-binding protein [Tissierella praeacuta]
MKKTLLVEGMSCGHCEKAVKNALKELNGVLKVEVDLSSKKVEIEGEGLNDILIKGAIEDAGYDLIEIR